MEFGESLINEVKLELVCDDSQVENAIELIRDHARTGQTVSGWVYVSEIFEQLSNRRVLATRR